MKRILSIVMALALLNSVAAPMQSMLGAKGIINNCESENKGYTASDYVQDGLIAIWDGIENVNWNTHDSQAMAWTELISGTAKVTTNSTYRRWNATEDGMEVPPEVASSNGQEAYVYNPIPRDTCKAARFVEFVAYKTNPSYSLGYGFGGWQWCNSAYTGFGFLIRTGSEVNERLSISLLLGTDGAYSRIVHRSSSAIQNGGGGTQANTSGIFGTFGIGKWSDPHVGICSIRIYDRELSTEEVAHNYEIDKERFGAK